MNAPDLISQLREAGYSIKIDGFFLDISPAEDLPADIVQQLKKSKPEIMAVLKLEQQQEVRLAKVLAMLEADPQLSRALHVDVHDDQHNAIITIAVRGVVTCELLVPKDKFDAWQLIALVDKMEVKYVH